MLDLTCRFTHTSFVPDFLRKDCAFHVDKLCVVTGMDARGGRGMPPGGMHGPGPRAGPPGKAANVGDDKWGKRSLPPPPPGMGGGAMGNLPALHQAEKKFKVQCFII